ncbi:hypothetical protein [Limnochorda pilosa]|uniref:Spore coat protein U domain-containing protein n=1 Tax=Limnochorda pilosa TaxID=1555112 RepID=A0A0K2SHV2_LIMPI|nr:hypothetical protein [Limnochorda pilosa]BAS26429.1 hypothetical protein LIP_0572 [Limnochorda pilosa]
MRKLALLVVLLGILLLAGSNVAVAQTTATQDVTIVVNSIDTISVSGNPGTITVSGPLPATVTENTTTMDYSTNGTNLKITAALDLDYAAGITLSVELTPGAGEGTAASKVALSTVAADVVTGISNVSATLVPITYTADVLATAAPNAPGGETHTVTFTITL